VKANGLIHASDRHLCLVSECLGESACRVATGDLSTTGRVLDCSNPLQTNFAEEIGTTVRKTLRRLVSGAGQGGDVIETGSTDVRDVEVHRGAAVYSRPVLGIYDLLVVRLSNSFAWRCHRDRMAEQYRSYLGKRHLDVGPGTGWYLANMQLPAGAVVTLMDLNANSLASASARLSGVTTSRLVANVLEPLPEAIGPWDSIGVNYLFHCVPGSWAAKGAALGYLAGRLTGEGVLFGSTILGRGVDHNVAGRGLMALYNRRGIFHNAGDDREGLEAALHQHFSDVTVEVVGTVALFHASGPRRVGSAR